MLTESSTAHALVLGALLIACPHLAAFEPGSERTCEPSADGQRFVCRDASGNEVDSAEQTPPAETEPMPATTPESEPAPAAEVPPPSDNVPSSTAKLPNYLFHNPGSPPVRAAPAPTSKPAPAPEPEPVSTPAEPPSPPPPRKSAQPVEKTVPARTPMAKPTAAPDAASASVPMAAPEEPVTRPSPATPAKQPVQQASSPAPAAVARPATNTPAQASAPASSQDSSSKAAPRARTVASVPSRSQRPTSSASEFKALPGSHYTLVLDSARSTGELNPLIDALEGLPGKLYLVALNMPDGRWYSLCWSNFDSMDAARAARADLPADAPITSGWPRRISLLQSEIK